MKPLAIRPARGPVLWLLRRFGFWGLTTIWAIYVAPEHLRNDRLIRHERMHEQQMRRHGRMWFCVLYAWELLRRGYWNNRFEIEARAAEEMH